MMSPGKSYLTSLMAYSLHDIIDVFEVEEPARFGRSGKVVHGRAVRSDDHVVDDFEPDVRCDPQTGRKDRMALNPFKGCSENGSYGGRHDRR